MNLRRPPLGLARTVRATTPRHSSKVYVFELQHSRLSSVSSKFYASCQRQSSPPNHRGPQSNFTHQFSTSIHPKSPDLGYDEYEKETIHSIQVAIPGGSSNERSLLVAPYQIQDGSIDQVGQKYERLLIGLQSSPPVDLVLRKAQVAQSFCRSYSNDSSSNKPISRGLGLFATTDISFGDAILHERPTLIFTYPSAGTALVPQLRRLLARLCTEELTRHELDKLKALSRVAGSDGRMEETDISWLGDVIETNGIIIELAVDAQYSSDLSVGAILLNTARCNHSCSPNAYVVYDASAGCATVIATSSISKGEEITLSYIDVLAPREERYLALRKKWGFICDCPSCALSYFESATSDSRRHQIQNWFSQSTAGGEENSHLTASSISLRSRNLTSEFLRTVIIPSAESFVQLCDEEGELQVGLLYSTKERLALCYSLLGDTEKFGYWAKRAQGHLRGIVNSTLTIPDIRDRVAIPGLRNNMSLHQWEEAIEHPTKNIRRWGKLAQT